MYNAAISFVRRLSGAADNDDDLHQPEDFSSVNRHNAETTRDDDGEEYDEEDDDGEDDEDDEQMPERRVGLVDYDSDDDDSEEAEDDDDNDNERNDGEHDDGEDEEDMGGPSVDDLFGPGELERRMAEEAAGIDPYAEEFAGMDPYVDEFAEARTEVDDDDLAARNADFDEDVPEISEEERAATEAIYAEIRRKVAEDEAARAAAFDTPYVASPSSSSSSAGSESTSTGSDFMGSCAEPANGAREFRTPPPEDLDEPTTPVLNALPLTREELVVPTADMVASLAGAARGLILRTMLGHGHRTVIRPSRHGPPTPYTSPRTSPAPDFGIDEADNTHAPVPPPAAPRNALKRTMNADYFLADGIGGYFSTRAQHQVSRPWEPSYEDTMRLNERRRAEAAAAAAAALSVQQQQTAPPVRSPSVESDDVDMAGIDSAEEDDGDCSPSPGEGTSSQIQQAVEPPVHIATPPASPSPSHRQKRARSEDDTVDDGAQPEKRRRVIPEAQPGSPAATSARPRGNQAGSPTAATRNSMQDITTTSTAPAPPSAGLDVVENDVDVDNASDEMHVESLILEPVAGPSRQPATASPAATPKRQSRRRGRAVQKTPTSPRRSTRIRENAARRAKAAEDARAAAAAAPKTIARRGKRSGNGRA